MKSYKYLLSTLFFTFLCSSVFGQNIYTVNTTDDFEDGTCDDLHCSLREAILAAIADGTASQIHFNLIGDVPFEIKVSEEFPFLGDNTVIDGSTQPNFQIGDIILNGAELPSEEGRGLRMKNHCAVYGLHFKNFRQSGINLIGENIMVGAADKGNIMTESTTAIEIFNSQNCKIENNLIGINAQNQGLANEYGIDISGNLTINNLIINNTIAHNQFIARTGFQTNNQFTKNNIFCNQVDAIWFTPPNNQVEISSYDIANQEVIGSSGPNCLIEVFLADSCQTLSCQGQTFVGTTTSDSAGNWSLNIGEMAIGQKLTAISYSDELGYSNFADCYIVNDCPDNQLAVSINGISPIVLGDSFSFTTTNTNANLPIISHGWDQIQFFSPITIQNNLDGTADISAINGIVSGGTRLIYEMIDSRGCSAQEEFPISIQITCNNINGGRIEVSNTLDEGPGSFRRAIWCANRNPTVDTIIFAIPNVADSIIYVQSALPVIRDANTIIDGTTHPLGKVIIDGAQLPDNNRFNGLDILSAAENSEIYGLQIQNFSASAIFASPDNIKIGSLEKGNIFTNNRVGITLNNTANGNPIASITGNVFAYSDKGVRALGSEANILQNTFHHMRSYAIEILRNGGLSKGVKISENSFYCNDRVILRFNNQKAEPLIRSVSEAIIGIAEANDSIEIYLADEECATSAACQGRFLLGKVQADAEGNWTFPTPENIQLGDRITALAINAIGNTSDFAACYIVLPDDCRFAQPLPVNEAPCSSVGIVLDLKQMTDAQPAPTSICSDTYQGKDAWYKIGVPETGNFLVRTNINNTVVPVIEIYTACGNTALPECMILDSLPSLMVFENYTPADTLLLRVWDKENGVVNSENTAFLHLTAHELASDKDDWEICDYDNLISANPTNLVRREANSFIVDYELNTSQSEIDQTTAELIAEGLTLEKECFCGAQPIQLWGTNNPIELEDRRRKAKVRSSVDTTNYNYIFEAIEFQVNSYAIGQQRNTDIAMDSAGNFMMVWKDEQRRHNYGRMYKNSGNPISPEFQIGASATTQYNTKVAALDNGDFITVWQEVDETDPTAVYRIYGRLFSPEGVSNGNPFAISEKSANTSSKSNIKTTAFNGYNSSVAAGKNGQFVVGWENGAAIYAQKMNNNGTLNGQIIEVASKTSSGNVAKPSIDLADKGAFIIAWNAGQVNNPKVTAQRFDANGLVIDNQVVISSGQTSNPAVALRNDGSFIIVYEKKEANSSLDLDVFGQQFDNTGEFLGNEFQVNSYTNLAQKTPSIALFDNGSFLVAWSSLEQDGFAEGIYAKLFNVSGQAIPPNFDDQAKGSLGEEFRLNTYHDPQQDQPATATNGQNIFMGAWEDGANDGSFEGIFAQRYETIQRNNNSIFYPIGTATPSTLMGDELKYPATVYTPKAGAPRVKVAIIDTGIDEKHELINQALWQNPEISDNENCLLEDEIGYDFVNNLGEPTDIDGHGTQVNGMVVRSFDTNVQLELMNLKFHELDKGNVFDAICGIYYAVDNGANMLNLSWGFEASEVPVVLQKALQYAADRDVLIITTAGNTNKNNDQIDKYPANLAIPNMLVVTAYEYQPESETIQLANYASYGPNNVDIAAYGYVETAKIGGQTTLSAGTSLAAPTVARTAAIIKGLYADLTAAEIKACILSSAQIIPTLVDKIATGGILDHEAALACARQKSDSMTVSVENQLITPSIKVYPNPTQGLIKIELTQPSKHFAVRLLDGLGRQINTFSFTGNQGIIDVHHLSAGIYFLQLDIGFAKKIIVEKR